MDKKIKRFADPLEGNKASQWVEYEDGTKENVAEDVINDIYFDWANAIGSIRYPKDGFLVFEYKTP